MIQFPVVPSMSTFAAQASTAVVAGIEMIDTMTPHAAQLTIPMRLALEKAAVNTVLLPLNVAGWIKAKTTGERFEWADGSGFVGILFGNQAFS